jgi:hypothetical protein
MMAPGSSGENAHLANNDPISGRSSVGRLSAMAMTMTMAMSRSAQQGAGTAALRCFARADATACTNSSPEVARC